MSSRKRKPQDIPFNVKRNKKIDHYFPQGNTTQQNDSKNYPEDKTNPQAQGPTDQAVSLTKTVKVTWKGDHRAYEVKGSEGASFYEVLTGETGAIKEKIDSQKGKEMLVRGTGGIEGFINPGMPLSCFPENSHVEITFVQSRSKQETDDVFRRLDQKSGECVTFYIRAIGKEVKRIVKLRQLHKKGCKLCVYGFKEETIKEALCLDGRLLPLLNNLDWKLVENADTILENTQLVNDLEKRVFEVEFEKKPVRADMAENDEPEQIVTPLVQRSFVDQYPSLRSESQKVRMYLRKTKKISKTEFEKMIKNSTKVAVCKLLSRLSDSVGYLEWNIDGRQGSATCFVFKERYIFTSMHVLNLIVGEGIASHDWINIISQSAWVTFTYETQTDKEKNKFFIDSSFLMSDATLDYAVLKLKENGQELSGLYPEIDSIPPDGLIYIIGHPDGEAKDTDPCIVIECQREQECQKRIQNRSLFVHMYTGNSFRPIVNNSDVITHDTSFYFGSSGSPIFNSDGALVAIHNAGFAFEHEKKTSRIIEFGSSMKSILHHIYKSEGGTDWFKEIHVDTSSYIDRPVEDVEMVNEEENLEE